MKWWQIKKRDADLERELRSDLELEEEEREGGIAPSGHGTGLSPSHAICALVSARFTAPQGLPSSPYW
jgi:hypothetical protein